MELLTRERPALARRWMLLAASALAVSGLLAFGVVAARVPALARHLTDTELARRVLVVHVDLGVVVWFAALPVALFHLAAAGGRRAGRRAAVAPWLAAAGAVALGSGLIPGWGRPHTVNYVPLVDQPLFVAGLLLFAAGTGRPVAAGAAARVALGLLGVAALSVLPLLAAHPAGWRYHAGYAQLMRWGLFPGLVVFLGFVIVPHLRARRDPSSPAAARALRPLAASSLLMLAGLVYGALIRGSDLRIPGHYHATIGSATLAYMALTLLLLPRSTGADRADRPPRAPPSATARSAGWRSSTARGSSSSRPA